MEALLMNGAQPEATNKVRIAGHYIAFGWHQLPHSPPASVSAMLYASEWIASPLTFCAQQVVLMRGSNKKTLRNCMYTVAAAGSNK
eukprot:scaffold538794_cov17-Prasinocladus_malaysianus.AAC.1